jgi:hypothetical protein
MQSLWNARVVAQIRCAIPYLAKLKKKKKNEKPQTGCVPVGIPTDHLPIANLAG